MFRCQKCGSIFPCLSNGCACHCGFVNYFDQPEAPVEPQQVKPEEKPEEMPSLLQQAKNLGNSLVKHVANGAKKVPNDIYESRINTCDSCDYLQDDRCRACGCFVKLKAGWASEKCPLDKWGTYNTDNGKCGGCGGK